MNTNHTIEFGLKFCQSQLSEILCKNIKYENLENREESISHWKKSFLPQITQVRFDLTITEWVATEEIVFLFGWIRQLLMLKKGVKVLLPYGHDLSIIYSTEKLAYLKSRYHFVDNEKSRKKRYNRNIFLMINWGLRNNIGLKDWQFENLLDNSVYNRRYEAVAMDDTFNKVVPFSAIKADFDGSLVKYDGHFKEVLKGHQSVIGNKSLFTLEKRIETILTEHACHSPFESRILSNVIFQELYLNSCQHSFQHDQGQSIRECYMAVSFSSKRKTEDLPNLAANFRLEKDKEAIDFYKDKTKICQELQKDISSYGKIKDGTVLKASLSNYDFLCNQSYIEYTFLDFGQGFTATLQNEYLANKDEFAPFLSSQHSQANRDSQIIEYAFLLETSSIPLDKNVENYNLIPRGLYFLLDMVRRYKGMLKIHSGKGKVFYDFSDKIYLEIRNNKSHSFIHRPYNVKDAVIHCFDNEIIEDLEGVMISIILPEKDMTMEKQKDKRSISPVRLEHDVLNNYIYYTEKDKVIAGSFHYDDLHPKSYEYISLLLLFNQVIENYIQEESMRESELNRSLTTRELNQIFYNRLYSKLVEELKEFQGRNCVIFIDFGGLYFDTQFLKLVYYLLNTPRINELTKAVLVNLEPDKTRILENIKKNVQDELLVPYLYKPLPCLYFNGGNTVNSVKWIGLRDEKDEAILTKVLFGEGSIEKNALESSKNAEGNIFYEFDGWIYSFLLPITTD